MNNEKFKEILYNADFQKEAEGMKTIEDAQKLLAKYGLELSTAEVEKAFAEIGEAANAAEGELSEDALEDVAGGFAWGVVLAVAPHVIRFAIGVYKGYKG